MMGNRMALGHDRGARSELVRQSNLSLLLGHLHHHGSTTRSDLVAATGLTRSAVGALVGELHELGFVDEERSQSDGHPGRPSPLVRPIDRNVVISMEVLVDSIAVAVVALGGNVLTSAREVRPRLRHSPGNTVARLAQMTESALSDVPGDVVLHGVGVAVAGVVRREEGVVAVAPNVGWTAVPLRDLIREAIGLEAPIHVGNEGDLGALAESRRGVATGLSDVVYISGEVGVGGGVIVDGRPLVGTAGFAGEVGHIPVRVDGAPCNCGATGCWETEVGEQALLRRVGRPDTGGRDAFRHVLADAEAGDADVLRALRDHGTWLGFGLAGIVNLFDPELIVLGGDFTELFPFVEASLSAELERRVFDVIRQQVAVVPARLTFDAPLLGAAEWAWDQAIIDPAASSRTAVAARRRK